MAQSECVEDQEGNRTEWNPGDAVGVGQEKE